MLRKKLKELLKSMDNRMRPKLQGKIFIKSSEASILEAYPYNLPFASELLSLFPKELTTNDENQAETTIELSWDVRNHGFYSAAGRLGKVILCEVVVRNRGTSEVIAKRLFEGSPPPESIRLGTRHSPVPIFGDPPGDAVKSYLKQFLVVPKTLPS